MSERPLMRVEPVCPRCANALTWVRPQVEMPAPDGVLQPWDLRCDGCGYAAEYPRFVEAPKL